jgi:GNAT superfamily N-acetyltransferase
MRRPKKPVAPPPGSAPRLALEPVPSGAVARMLWRGLIRHNTGKAGAPDYSRQVITARTARGRLVGGLILESYYLESYVELLWVSERSRTRGIGTRLLKRAEDLARARGSRLVHLNTYSFQAPAFYARLGYRRFGTLRGSPRGAQRFFYAKALAARRKR